MLNFFSIGNFILGNYCEGYRDGTLRKHPNNDCNDYVECHLIDGKMYAFGNLCPNSHCINFNVNPPSCLPCDSTFTCEELTTPGKYIFRISSLIKIKHYTFTWFLKQWREKWIQVLISKLRTSEHVHCLFIILVLS